MALRVTEWCNLTRETVFNFGREVLDESFFSLNRHFQKRLYYFEDQPWLIWTMISTWTSLRIGWRHLQTGPLLRRQALVALLGRYVKCAVFLPVCFRTSSVHDGQGLPTVCFDFLIFPTKLFFLVRWQKQDSFILPTIVMLTLCAVLFASRNLKDGNLRTILCT